MMQEHLLDSLNGNLPPMRGDSQWPQEVGPGMTSEMTSVNGHNHPEFVNSGSPELQGQISSSDLTSTTGGSGSSLSAAQAAAAAAKKSSSRRNAWGNLSYADLITQAIQSAPEKRLTLSQVYEWMVANIPYFKDKGDSNSSAGWKVRNFSSESCLYLALIIISSSIDFWPLLINQG